MGKAEGCSVQSPRNASPRYDMTEKLFCSRGIRTDRVPLRNECAAVIIRPPSVSLDPGIVSVRSKSVPVGQFIQPRLVQGLEHRKNQIVSTLVSSTVH